MLQTTIPSKCHKDATLPEIEAEHVAEMENTLCIKNLNFKTTEATLEQVFKKVRMCFNMRHNTFDIIIVLYISISSSFYECTYIYIYICTIPRWGPYARLPSRGRKPKSQPSRWDLALSNSDLLRQQSSPWRNYTAHWSMGMLLISSYRKSSSWPRNMKHNNKKMLLGQSLLRATLRLKQRSKIFGNSLEHLVN